MKNLMKHMVVLTLVIVLSLSSSTMMTVRATSKNITIGEYIELLMKAMKVTIKEAEDETYIEAAVSTGVLKTIEEFKVENEMTRAECAVLTNRADIYVNGVTADTKIFDEIKDHKRISDLSKISKEYIDDVVQVFGKGIIVGYTNGKYTQNRAFKGSNKITYNGAKEVIKKFTNKKLRGVMSPDGQLTRTTNLPCNAKEYEYILASFPNKFYEMKYQFELGNRNTRYTEFNDYCVPVRMKKMPFVISGYEGTAKETQAMINKYLDDWVEKIEKNLYYRFNVNYKTINSKWISNFRNTYCVYNNEDLNNEIEEAIKQYVKEMKKNKVIIKTQKISVEPSTLYYSQGKTYIRCYIKFMVTSASSLTDTLVYNKMYKANFIDLKVNKWHESYYDISVGVNNGSSYGDDWAVFGEFINDYFMQVKTKVMVQKFNKKGNSYFPNGYYYWK